MAAPHNRVYNLISSLCGDKTKRSFLQECVPTTFCTPLLVRYFLDGPPVQWLNDPVRDLREYPYRPELRRFLDQRPAPGRNRPPSPVRSVALAGSTLEVCCGQKLQQDQLLRVQRVSRHARARPESAARRL